MLFDIKEIKYCTIQNYIDRQLEFPLRKTFDVILFNVKGSEWFCSNVFIHLIQKLS